MHLRLPTYAVFVKDTPRL